MEAASQDEQDQENGLMLTIGHSREKRKGEQKVKRALFISVLLFLAVSNVSFAYIGQSWVIDIDRR